jgi:protein-tyrosine phosphatase
MIDIHSHVIFGVDDGPSEIKESIRMVLEAEELGITDIIATPHFNREFCNTEKVNENYNEIKRRVAGCGINIHLGYEVSVSSLISSENRMNPGLALAKSKYLLFELPFDNLPVYTYDIIQNMHSRNIIPVIAHPERNTDFLKNFDAFLGFVENGCLVQVDAPGILGFYGSKVKGFVKKIIKLNLVHFVASDSHCADDYTQYYLQAYNQVKHWVGEEHTKRLFEINPGRVLCG